MVSEVLGDPPNRQSRSQAHRRESRVRSGRKDLRGRKANRDAMARPDHKAPPGRRGLQAHKVPRVFPALRVHRVSRGLPDPRVSLAGTALKGPPGQRGRPDLRGLQDHLDLLARRLKLQGGNPVYLVPLARQDLKVPRGRPVRKVHRVSPVIRALRGRRERRDHGVSPVLSAQLVLQVPSGRWEPKGLPVPQDPRDLLDRRASPGPLEKSAPSVLQGLPDRLALPD